jgi:hypothetical protein
VHLRHEHLLDRLAQLAPAATHVVAHRRLGDVGTLLLKEPLPDPFRRVPLLARRLPIRDQPLVDQGPGPSVGAGRRSGAFRLEGSASE